MIRSDWIDALKVSVSCAIFSFSACVRQCSIWWLSTSLGPQMKTTVWKQRNETILSSMKCWVVDDQPRQNIGYLLWSVASCRIFVTPSTTWNIIHLQIDALEPSYCSQEVFENRKQERAVEGREKLMRSFESGFWLKSDLCFSLKLRRLSNPAHTSGRQYFKKDTFR